MTWVIIVGTALGLLTLGQLRVHRTEKLRVKCLDLAITSRRMNPGIYMQAEKTEAVLGRAVQFEDYVRKGIPKEEEEEVPP